MLNLKTDPHLTKTIIIITDHKFDPKYFTHVHNTRGLSSITSVQTISFWDRLFFQKPFFQKFIVNFFDKCCFRK